MGATTILSEFASQTRLAGISTEALAATKRHILDCTGVGLAATVEPAGRIVMDMTREQGGTPQARVLGCNLRTSAVSAAWANGALAHLPDFDDTGFSHPTACILPATLAMAEEAGASGADVVAAAGSIVRLNPGQMAVAIRAAAAICARLMPRADCLRSTASSSTA